MFVNVSGLNANFSTVNNKSALLDAITPTLSVTTHTFENLLSNTSSRNCFTQPALTSYTSKQASYWQTKKQTTTFIQAKALLSTSMAGDTKTTSLNQITETKLRSSLSSTTVLQTSEPSVSIFITSWGASIGNTARTAFGTFSVEAVNSSKSRTPLTMGNLSDLRTPLNYTFVQTKRKTATLANTAKASTATFTPFTSVLSSAVVTKNSSLHFKTDNTSMKVTANIITFKTESVKMASLAGTKSDSSLLQQGSTASPDSRFVTRVAAPSSTTGGPIDSQKHENLSTTFSSLQNTGTIVSSSQSNETKESMFVTAMATARHTLSKFKGCENGSSSHRITMDSYGFSHRATKISFSTKPTAFTSASILKVQTKTLSSRAIPFSNITSTTDLFTDVNTMRTSVSVPLSTTVVGFSPAIVQSKSSVAQGIAFSRIFKATNAISTVDVLQTSIAVSYYSTITGCSSPMIQNKTSMIQQVIPKTSAFSSWLDVLTKSVAVSSHNSTVIKTATLSMVQNKTSSFQMLTFSETTNVTVTSVAASDNSIIIASLSPFVQSEQSLMHDVSSSKIYERTVVSSEANVHRKSSAVPLSSTIASFSPLARDNTFSTRVISSSDIFKITDISLKVNISTRSAPVFNNGTITWSSSPMEQDKTSQLRMLSSSKNSKTTEVFSSVQTPRTSLEVPHKSTIMGLSLTVIQSVTFTRQNFSSSKSTKTTDVFSELSASRASVVAVYYSTITRTTLAMEQNKTATTQVTDSSEISKVETSKQLQTSKAPDNVSFVSSRGRLISENTSDSTKLPRTVHMTPGYYPSVQATIVKTETKKTEVVGSTFTTHLLTEVASRHSLNMTTDISHGTTRVTSSIKIIRTIDTSFTVQPPSTDLSVITTTPLATVATSALGETTPVPVLQKTGSITSGLPTSLSTLQASVLESGKTLMPTLTGGTFTTYQTKSSSMSSKHLLSNTDVLTSQLTVTGKSLSTDISGKSSITNVSEKQNVVASSSAFPKRSSLTIVTSTPLPSILSSEYNISISFTIIPDVSRSNQTRKESTVAVSISSSNSYVTATTAYAELISSVTSKQLTFSSNLEHTLTTKQSLTSTVSNSPPSTGKSSSTIVFISFSPNPTSSALVMVQTRPPAENPRQFEGSMVLQMPWNPQYQIKYTPEFQALSSQVTRELTKVLRILENFLSVQVLRLWKGSVGVDFVVFMRQSAQLNESTVEKTLVEANTTGVLDLPMTSLRVKERRVATTSPSVPTSKSKSLERWQIILVVSGILVFLLLLIICILAVSHYQIHFLFPLF